MQIIRRLALGWEDEDGYGKYQYLYRKGNCSFSLVYLEIPRGKFMWELYGMAGGHIGEHGRFNTQEEAEEIIMDILVGDDLKDLVEWKIAKSNMIIQDGKRKDNRRNKRFIR